MYKRQAQSLYEKRPLTYPRTDSSFLTDDMGGTAAGIIALLCEKLPFMAGADFTPEVAKVLDSKKVSDHHAIIPTMAVSYTHLDVYKRQQLKNPNGLILGTPGSGKSFAAKREMTNACLLYTSRCV